MVTLKKGDIVSDFNDYLNQSEQIPSHVQMFSECSEDGLIQSSYGLMIQNIPDKATTNSSPNEVNHLAKSLGEIPWNEFKKMDCQEVLKKILPFDFSVVNSTILDFFCRCSLNRFKSTLKSMPLSEVVEMQQLNQREITCQYCNRTYTLSDVDFGEILQEITKNKQKN